MPRDIHVLPMGDLRDHAETRDCWCCPMVEREEDAEAVVIHASADGREPIERHGVN